MPSKRSTSELESESRLESDLDLDGKFVVGRGGLLRFVDIFGDDRVLRKPQTN